MVCIEIISAGIYEVNWIASAVGEHVIAQNALPGGCKCVRIEESAYAGIIISALEIIQSGFDILKLALKAKMRVFQHPRKPWDQSIPWPFEIS